MATVPAVVSPVLDASLVESVLLQGDLSRLTPAQRVAYYNRVCESLGLNPLTKPFDYLNLNGKTVLYAKRDATEQLRKIHGVSIVELNSREVGGVFVVTAKAQDKQQRIDVSTGAVTIANLKGEALANALMKAETKAKRRVTLSICGLGLLDESEVETIPRAAIQATTHTETVNTETGEIVEQTTAPAEPEPMQYTGTVSAKGPRKVGKAMVYDFHVDDQVMSTTELGVADKVGSYDGQRATVTFRRTPKGGIMLLDIAAASPLAELAAEEVGFLSRYTALARRHAEDHAQVLASRAQRATAPPTSWWAEPGTWDEWTQRQRDAAQRMTAVTTTQHIQREES